MTEASLGWFIAGICLAGFVTLWFSVSYRELCRGRESLDAITEQVRLHRTLCMGERGGENDAAAKNMLENKLLVYREVARNYNALLKKPMYRLPAYLLGFRPAKKEGCLDQKR